MAFYRTTFPEASIVPKKNMLESHVVPYIQQWGVGLGFLAEQGAESIHSTLNNISRAYVNMPDKVERLKCILLEHHRQTCPTLAQQQPAVKKFVAM